MHIIFQLLLVTFFATSAMTIFSYIISIRFRKLYEEPLLLQYVLERIKVKMSIQVREILGWLIHYIVGFIFVSCYYFLWEYQFVPLTIISGIYLGAISGIIGIISWVVMFKLAHFFGKVSDKGYYFQLFIAHIIFGLTAVIDYMYLADLY